MLMLTQLKQSAKAIISNKTFCNQRVFTQFLSENKSNQIKLRREILMKIGKIHRKR